MPTTTRLFAFAVLLSGCTGAGTGSAIAPSKNTQDASDHPMNQPVFPQATTAKPANSATAATGPTAPAVPIQSLRVQIFPHLSRYSEPQGKESDPSQVSLTSTGACQMGGLDPGDVASAATSPIHFTFASLTAPERVTCSKPVTVVREAGLRSYTYDGVFEIKRGDANQVRVIDVLPLEDYLRGVVPAEVPSTWTAAALEAQAVAARSYALYQVGSHTASDGIPPDVDVDDTVLSQAYLGLTVAAASSDQAIQATANEIVQFDHHVAVTFFSADAGGYSEDAENVFGPVAQGYCQAKQEPFALSLEPPPWVVPFTLSTLMTALEADGLAVASNPVTGMVINEAARFRSGRVNQLTLQYTDGTSRVIEGAKLAGALGLRSTLFSVQKDATPSAGTSGQPAFTITGRGYGHGVGMAQIGAHILASQLGWTYQQILNFYYTGIQLCQVGVDCG